MLLPKFFTTIRTYTRAQFFADLSAGVVVGVVALPLAIAFAIASDLSPDRGLVTGVVAGFLISFLGGSRVQIGGPTGAFVVIVSGIAARHGFNGLLIATMMAGVLLVIMGLARLGSVIKFIPYPVTVGFTSGIALIILSSQVKDFLGLSIAHVPSEFIEKWGVYLTHLSTLNYWALAIGAGTVLIAQSWRRVTAKIPGSLVALVLSTLLVHFFHLPVETIGSRFGAIPNALPVPALPHLTLPLIRELMPSAVTIALLAAIESLLSAVVSDGMIGGKHRSNMELVAQGIANIVSPLFGGMPATGAIARTTTNVQNGGRTPVAGMIHALILLAIMFFLGPLAALIPLACLAGILVVVAYHMSEWHSFVMVLRSPRSDAAVLVVTFLLTVVVDLTVAIEVGMVLAAFLFMRRMALVSNTELVTAEMNDEEEPDDPEAISKKVVPKGVLVYEVNGPFFFGASANFMEALSQIGEKNPKVIIIRMRHVPVMDATGLHVLKTEIRKAKGKGIAFILSGVGPGLRQILTRAELVEMLGKQNVIEDFDSALSRAREILEAR
ncbi:MAG: sodium-independent anion transporter [Omnitrophica bacterium GWA2_52_12]|nr:MAG: sodium-independent anion transporter [Omnitrophica bacterium GWA2_52_12]